MIKLPDLKLIYKTLVWHQSQRDKKPGESVGIFITLPEELANQFPIEGKSAEDTSPSHVTVLYCGDIPLSFEDKLKEVTKKCCENMKPFVASLSKPQEFINHKNQRIVHSPVKSQKLHDFHDFLKKEFLINQIPVDNKHPEYKPHVTIRYIQPDDEAIYNDNEPKGEWIVNSCWIWGGQEPYLVGFGK